MNDFAKKGLKLIGLGVACFAFFLIIASEISNQPIKNNSPEARVAKTMSSLNFYRKSIGQFYKDKGFYPDKLESLPLSPEDISYLAEFLSSKEGNESYSVSLSGQGGWFYDPKTGKICVNLTNPLQDLLPDYKGDMLKEVPSDW